MMSPGALRNMRVDPARLRLGRPTHGIGGASANFVETAYLMFHEPGVGYHFYVLQLDICVPNDDNRWLPSLLGRDVLDHWTMTYSPKNARLGFEVHEADLTRSGP